MEIKARLNIFIPLSTAMLIFIATALVGVWAAPNRFLAQRYLVPLILVLWLMILIALALRHKVETAFGILGLISAYLTVFFALFLIPQLGLWDHSFGLDILGTILIVLLPFGFCGAIWAREYRFYNVTSTIAIVIGLLGLILTGSRSTWLGFGLAVGYTVYFIWRFETERQFSPRWLVDLIIAAFTIGFIAVFLIPFKIQGFEDIPSFVLGESTGRAALWCDTLPLIQDYPFTGSGLGSTTMVYSSYVFLLHIPFLSHAHNLFLQIALEQGIPGLIAFIAMTLFAILGLIDVYRHSSKLIRVYTVATFAALMALFWHGIMEAGLYAHILRPIMFLPFGFTLILLLGNINEQAIIPQTKAASKRVNRLAIAGSLAPIVAIVAFFLWPGSSTRLQANMGAVAQTRAELAIYRWPEWPIQDEVRRNQAVDLSVAIDHYKKTLALNPMNVTAHRRLGQIEISMGHYELAQQHLEAAFKIAPDQRATRQMLGEIYAINGDLERAIRLWKTIDTTHGQLDARHWWYTHIGVEQEAEWLKQAISQLNMVN